jgi:GT2 family glycosyltransferase
MTRAEVTCRRGGKGEACPRIGVVILNWHSAEATLACVAALRRSRGVEVDVLVVDNGSTDGSADRLARALGSDALLTLPDNRGYAGGMNAGFEAIGQRLESPYTLVLTPDALVEEWTIARLHEALERAPAAAVAGPVVVYRMGEGRLLGAGGGIDRRRARAPHYRTLQGSEPYAVDWVDGCCMLLRRDAAAAVGGFDERYFLYFEETDFCCRITRGGWQVLLVPGVEVLHEKDGVPGLYYYYYMNRNRYLFWQKNFGVRPGRVALAIAGETAGLVASWVLSLLVPGRRRRRGDDQRRLVRQLRGVLAGTRDFMGGRFGAMPVRE